MQTTKEAIDLIKARFLSEGNSAEIPKMRGGTFNAWLREDGIEVDNLNPSNNLLPWAVFQTAIETLIANGGTAEKGDAMAGTLGSEKLPTNTIEGSVASKVYDVKPGESVFRRITPVTGILTWAGICENLPGALKLKSKLNR